MDIVAIVALIALVAVVNLGPEDLGGGLLALLFFAIPLLALAGILTALKVSDRKKSPVAGWALAIGILLLAPSVLFVCAMAFLLTGGSLP